MEKYLETGKIVNTHGVRGFVKAEAWCDSPKVLADLSCVYVLKNGSFEKIKILNSSLHKGFVLLHLEGCDDLDTAIAWKNTVLYADRNDISLNEGDYFIADLIGLSVYDANTNRCYGKILQVINRGASDIYEIEMPNRRLTYLPAVAEFVQKIDLEQGVFVTPIPGFFDEEETDA